MIMNGFNTIEVEYKSGVATVWLNKPDLHNAVSIEMLDELTKFFTQLNTTEHLRVIVLRGRGKSFSAGADLKRMLHSNSLGFDENLKDAEKWADCLNAIYSCELPTVGVANGNVFGGGNGLLCACDMVIAEESAVFSFSEVKLGLAPSTILPYVLTRVNEHKAKYLMLTGRRIKAKEAKEFNVIDILVSTDELEQEVQLLTKDLIAASPNGVKEIKRLVRELTSKSSPDLAKGLTTKSIASLKISKEAYEGISAFMEKRPPAWTNID